MPRTILLSTSFLVLLNLMVITGCSQKPTDKKTDPSAAKTDLPQVGGLPLFTGWPENQAPDATLVLTGQTFGYLSPCGCSRPQKGGLERRYNFMETLRKKGWYVTAVDLGDAVSPKGLHKQNLMKYKYTMRALDIMGYGAIGLGEYEFAGQLYDLLAEYPLNNPGKAPLILSGNLIGAQRDQQGKVQREFSREEYFPGADPKKPMVLGWTVIEAAGKLPIGVIAVIGPDVAEKAEKQDKQFAFQNNQAILTSALAEMAKHPSKPSFKVLLYAGKSEQAKEASKVFPQFQVVLCQSEDSEPPQFPSLTNDGKSVVIQVGHKGQNIGVLGIYAKGTQFDMKYQLVPLGEEYLTPEGEEAEKNHKILQLLEQYTQEGKDQNLLALYAAKKVAHPAMLQKPDAKLSYVGSEKCAQCHAAEYKVWKEAKHSHAYEALEKYAKRPKNQQFNGECLQCHTTGFDYAGGYVDEKTTPTLKNNGCENCHGPGSAHSAKPDDKSLYALLSPWKVKPDDKLPDTAFFKKMAEIKPIDRASVKVTANQAQMITAVSNMCMKCHDQENDPKFDIYEYFPKIRHSGLKNAGLPDIAK